MKHKTKRALLLAMLELAREEEPDKEELFLDCLAGNVSDQLIGCFLEGMGQHLMAKE